MAELVDEEDRLRSSLVANIPEREEHLPCEGNS